MGDAGAAAAAMAAGLRERLWAAEEQVRLPADEKSTHFVGFGLRQPVYGLCDANVCICRCQALTVSEGKHVGVTAQRCSCSCLIAPQQRLHLQLAMTLAELIFVTSETLMSDG